MERAHAQIYGYQVEIERLLSGKVASRIVLRKVLTKLGLGALYPFLKKTYTVSKKIKSFPNYLMNIGSSPNGCPEEMLSVVQKDLSSLQIALSSDLVEAFIRASSFPQGLGDDVLESLFTWSSVGKKVLCLDLASSTLQAALMLAAGGCQVSVSESSKSLIDYGSFIDRVNFFQGSVLAMLEVNSVDYFEQFDYLLSDNFSFSFQNLYMGRLASGNRLLVCVDAEGVLPELPEGCVIEQESAGVVVCTLPNKWFSIFSQGKILSEGLLCLKSVKPLKFPQTLPSGHPWPLISVVTVTYNQADYLEETICSVLEQGYPRLEYILIDGASNDGTEAIIDRYRSSFTYVISEPDAGQSEALNKGFAQAQGSILAWLNSDDCYLPDTLYRVALAFDMYQTDMIVGGCALVSDCETDIRALHHCRMPLLEPVVLSENNLLNLEECWLKGDFFYQPEVFWTRDLWERCGSSVDPELYYSMDYDLWVKMARQQATLSHIPEILTIFREHAGQKTAGEDLPYLSELQQVNQAFKVGKR